MNRPRSRKIRVVRPDEIVWDEVMRPSGELDPPGSEFVAATSVDQRFSFGLWRRGRQRHEFTRPYHEICYILEGEVEITDDDGEVIVARPGDILVMPLGSRGFWKSRSPVKMVRAIYEETGADLDPYIGPGGF